MLDNFVYRSQNNFQLLFYSFYIEHKNNIDIENKVAVFASYKI